MAIAKCNDVITKSNGYYKMQCLLQNTSVQASICCCFCYTDDVNNMYLKSDLHQTSHYKINSRKKSSNQVVLSAYAMNLNANDFQQKKLVFGIYFWQALLLSFFQQVGHKIINLSFLYQVDHKIINFRFSKPAAERSKKLIMLLFKQITSFTKFTV